MGRPNWADARDVCATSESMALTAREQRDHASLCEASEAARLLPAIVRPWGLRVASFEGAAAAASEVRALRDVLRSRALEPAHAAALASEESLARELRGWLATAERAADLPPESGGATRALHAAALRFDVRVVVLSTASDVPLTFGGDGGGGEDVVLGHYSEGCYVALEKAPRSDALAVSPPGSDIYARFKAASAVAARPAARAPTAFEKVRLAPDEVRRCAAATPPDFYVTSETARRLAGDGPDLGTYVGRFEDRVPDVQYLTTPEACFKYGCFVLPTTDTS